MGFPLPAPLSPLASPLAAAAGLHFPLAGTSTATPQPRLNPLPPPIKK